MSPGSCGTTYRLVRLYMRVAPEMTCIAGKERLLKLLKLLHQQQVVTPTLLCLARSCKMPVLPLRLPPFDLH